MQSSARPGPQFDDTVSPVPDEMMPNMSLRVSLLLDPGRFWVLFGQLTSKIPVILPSFRRPSASSSSLWALLFTLPDLFVLSSIPKGRTAYLAEVRYCAEQGFGVSTVTDR